VDHPVGILSAIAAAIETAARREPSAEPKELARRAVDVFGRMYAGRLCRVPSHSTQDRRRRDAAIRRAHQEGVEINALAERYSLSRFQVYRILSENQDVNPKK
jgi:Mor family transcriptional regulator